MKGVYGPLSFLKGPSLAFWSCHSYLNQRRGDLFVCLFVFNGFGNLWTHRKRLSLSQDVQRATEKIQEGSDGGRAGAGRGRHGEGAKGRG